MGESQDATICERTVNPLDELLGYHLRRASIAMMTDLSHRLAEVALTLTEVSVLQLVSANPLITQSEIGRVISMKRANMAPLVAGLTTRGLIGREAMDGRSHGLTLTAAGRGILEASRVHMAKNESLFFARIPKAQRPAVLSALRRIWSLNP